MTTTTKTIREIQYIGPDGQPLDYVPHGGQGGAPPPTQPRLSSSSAVSGGNYEPLNNQVPAVGYANYQGQGPPPPPGGYPNYAEYPHRPPTPPSPSDRSSSPPPQHQQPGKLKMSCSSVLRGAVTKESSCFIIQRPSL